MGDFDIKFFLFEIRDNWNDECILYTDENRLDKNDDVWSTMVEWVWRTRLKLCTMTSDKKNYQKTLEDCTNRVTSQVESKFCQMDRFVDPCLILSSVSNYFARVKNEMVVASVLVVECSSVFTFLFVYAFLLMFVLLCQ